MKNEKPGIVIFKTKVNIVWARSRRETVRGLEATDLLGSRS